MVGPYILLHAAELTPLLCVYLGSGPRMYKRHLEVLCAARNVVIRILGVSTRTGTFIPPLSQKVKTQLSEIRDVGIDCPLPTAGVNCQYQVLGLGSRYMPRSVAGATQLDVGGCRTCAGRNCARIYVP